MARDPVIDLYARTLEYVWSRTDQVPTPTELADWLESRTWRVDAEWLQTIIYRLRTWPVGKNYPLIPDDDAMSEIPGNASVFERWWEPGAPPGDMAIPASARRSRLARNN